MRNPYDFFSKIRNASHLFQGVTDATTAHSQGREFIQAGKYLERVDKTARPAASSRRAQPVLTRRSSNKSRQAACNVRMLERWQVRR